MKTTKLSFLLVLVCCILLLLTISFFACEKDTDSDEDDDKTGLDDSNTSDDDSSSDDDDNDDNDDNDDSIDPECEEYFNQSSFEDWCEDWIGYPEDCESIHAEYGSICHGECGYDYEANSCEFKGCEFRCYKSNYTDISRCFERYYCCDGEYSASDEEQIEWYTCMIDCFQSGAECYWEGAGTDCSHCDDYWPPYSYCKDHC